MVAGGEPQRDRTFLVCWTRKEACLKALGMGVSAQLASIDVGYGPDLRVTAWAPLETAVTVQSLDWPGAAVRLRPPRSPRRQPSGSRGT